MTYVATNLLTEDRLKSLLKDWKTDGTYYFLRWYDRVSGFVSQLPEDSLSPEGQMFNREFELRWKKQGDRFSVLLLSTVDKELEGGWQAIKANWDYEDREAYVYPPTETRFPKNIQSSGVNIGQRYFRDRDTATIHFVALVAK